MDGVERKPGAGWSRRSEQFTVSGKPDLHILTGSDKGKNLRPEEVRITWDWPDIEGGFSLYSRSRWEASVSGHRIFPSGKLGAELWFDFTPSNEWKLPRPAWLLDLVREFGPEGWTYKDH
jgi:hypothetical protein